tara:strand:- start:1393 stop:1725 length:333 start_codon:yes stop_codon:yes gene_type:complete
MRAQEGVIRLAAMAGVPVYPVSYSTTRGKILGSWDRFFLAAPFSRGIVIWGDGIEVSRQDENGAFMKARDAIESSLTQITQTADAICNRDTVEPEVRDKPVKPHRKVAES